MENSNEYPENKKNEQLNQHLDAAEDDDTEFENPSTDPGFETEGGLTGREDERDGDIDSNLSISEMQKKQQKDQGTAQQNDALNYNNDRDNGAYNPKNI